MSELQSVIDAFAAQLTAIIDAQAMAQARSAVLAAFGNGAPAPKRRGRPPKALQAAAVPPPAKKARRKAPLQLCPVPGCKNPAAPIFGMVCAKHKDLPKAKIKKFREARKAKKLGLKPPSSAKRGTKRAIVKTAKGTKRRAKKAKPSKAPGDQTTSAAA
jgi:hypothetical protein